MAFRFLSRRTDESTSGKVAFSLGQQILLGFTLLITVAILGGGIDYLLDNWGWITPPEIYNADRNEYELPGLSQRLEDLRNVGLALAGIVGVVIVVWRGMSHSNQAKASLEQATASRISSESAKLQAENTSRQIALASAQQQKSDLIQLTQRYTQAITQLGTEDEYQLVTEEGGEDRKVLMKDHQSTRLGAIYALEAIAHGFHAAGDTRQYWAVLDLLCDFLRRKTKELKDLDPLPKLNAIDLETWEVKVGAFNEFKCNILNWKDNLPQPSPETNAIAIILGRLPSYKRVVDDEQQPDIVGLNLRNIKAYRVRWEGNYPYSDWQGANLSGGVMIKANLTGANFSRSGLIMVNLRQAQLSDSILEDSLLYLGNFFEADLTRTQMNRCKMTASTLVASQISNANLEEAWLMGVTFRRANLSDSRFDNAILNDAILTEANLERTRLNRAALIGANLNYANLKETDLFKANLCGADLGGTINLTQKQINSARTDENTELPEGLKKTH